MQESSWTQARISHSIDPSLTLIWPELPSIQRALANTIRKSLPRNTPPIVGSALQSDAENLLERGTQPIVRYLDDLAAALRAEDDAPEAVDWGRGLAKLF
jgi:hypothetical protein